MIKDSGPWLDLTGKQKEIQGATNYEQQYA